MCIYSSIGKNEYRRILLGTTVNMAITLNANSTLTCVFFFRGFSSDHRGMNNRIVNASGYIYEFK